MRITTSFKKICSLTHFTKVVQGSQGASKTYSILQRWILLAVESDHKEHCTIATDSFPNIRSGALKDFKDICNENGIAYHGTKTPASLRVGMWTFEFLGINDSKKGLGGRRHRLFINEANRITWEVARQLISRTHKEVILDFNPATKFWAHEQYVDTGDCDFIKLTYKDNEMLPQSEINSIERNAPWGSAPDENFWRVYGLGEIGFARGAIFKNEAEFESLPKGSKFFKAVGIDFGWEDPLSGVMVHFDRANRALYWREIFYASHANYNDLVNVIRNDPQANQSIAMCDHAPRDILTLKNKGINAYAAPKKGGLSSDIRRLKYLSNL